MLFDLYKVLLSFTGFTGRNAMQIRSAALIGAGAVGAYFIAGLSDYLGGNFSVIAEGERKKRLETKGLTINDRNYRLNVKLPEEVKGVDLLLVCTKYYGLSGAMDLIERAVGENTIVISPLNGVNSEEDIAEHIGEDHLIYSVMRIASAWDGDAIRYDPAKTAGIELGEKGSAEKTPRLLAVDRLFKEAGIRCTLIDDIIRDQWGKYALNICYNLPQALLNLGFGSYFASSHVAAIRDRLFDEVKAVGEAKGIDVPALANRENTCPYDTRFSTLQDLDAKRRTEVDMFLKNLMDMARDYNISVPYCEYTWHGIKALEEKNAGLIR